MLRPLPWSHRNLSEINSIAVANSRMGAAPKSPSHPLHHLRRPVRPQPQHPEQQLYHRPQQGEGDARAGHNEMRPGRRRLLLVRLSVGLRRTGAAHHVQFVEVLATQAQCARHSADLDEADTGIKVDSGTIARGYG